MFNFLTFFSFNNILSDISKIPLLPALLESNSEEKKQVDGLVEKKNPQSLLEWLTARQGLTNLEYIVKHSENSLKQVCQVNAI